MLYIQIGMRRVKPIYEKIFFSFILCEFYGLPAQEYIKNNTLEN